MPLLYTCPHCKTALLVEDDYAGETGPCSECGKTITIPTSPEFVKAPSFASPPPEKARFSRGKVIFLLVFFLGMVGFGYILLLAVKGTSETKRRMACFSNLQKINEALQSYNATHGQFPPAYTVDASGKKLHSWRTLLLPYLGHADLYGQLHLDEPWDSPYNLEIFKDHTIDCYQCLSAPGIPGVTNYVMVVGPHCVSDGPSAWWLNDLAKDASEAICIVETTYPFYWYEPEDLKAEEITFGINEDPLPDHSGGQDIEEVRKNHPLPGISSFHRVDFGNGVNVLRCDGHVKFLKTGTDPAEVKSMIEAKRSEP